MATYTALTTLPDRARAERLGAALERLEPSPAGVGVFELEDGSGNWEVGGYFTAPPDETALALLAAATGAAPFAVSRLPQTDWVAHVRRELTPVEAGRFFVHGSHDADKLPEGRIGLLIEAAMAFGTGHHGTTLGCLRALDRLAAGDFRPARVADIGCGTAVLAMAAARVFDAVVIASDIDEVAVQVAEANLRANALEDRVRCIRAAGLAHPVLAENRPFDLVFANILKGPLIDLAPSIADSLAPGGRVILSGILNRQADEILRIYGESGLSAVFEEQIGDWTTLELRRNDHC